LQELGLYSYGYDYYSGYKISRLIVETLVQTIFAGISEVNRGMGLN